MRLPMRLVVAERQEFVMSMHVYRGFEIYPLIYPHALAPNGSPHNYDAGFDAAVKICLRGTTDTLTQSQTFRLRDTSPFDNAGDARRASVRYAENIIDDNRDARVLRARRAFGRFFQLPHDNVSDHFVRSSS